MSSKIAGQIVALKNGVTDGLYLLEDDRTERSAQITAIRIERLAEEHTSAYQHIAIYDTTYHGKMLVLDGIVQMTVNDNFCYHEMITQVPMAVLPHTPRKALVIGSGEGGVVNQLCKNQCLEKIVWIDIDPDVVSVCKRHMPELHRHHDERVEFIGMDGMQIDDEAAFDLIVVDGTDPLEDKSSLWSEKFYRRLAAALAPDGIATVLAGWLWPDPDMCLIVRELGRAHFEQCRYYWFLDPSMKYGYMGVYLMTNSNIDPTEPRFIERVPVEMMQFYNPAVHTAAFAMPNCFKPEAAFVPPAAERG